MKSWKNLFQQIIEKENILTAMHDAAKDKGAYKAGKGRVRNKDKYADDLIKRLKDGTWEPPEHIPCEINDGISQKKRTIIKPTYEEQVVHHAIIQVLKPVFMRGMYEYSCGSIPKRGGTYGKKYLDRYIRNHPENCGYCLKMDIKHFFQSIDNNKLMEMLAKIIKDNDMLNLLDKIIYREGGEDEVGIPIGFYTSQWFSNYFLQGLDHFIKEHLHAKCYVRYMDDMVIFDSNKTKLHYMRMQILGYLWKLGLRMNRKWQVFKFTMIRFLDFMGYRFYPNRTTLRKSIYIRAMRKARQIYTKTTLDWYTSCQMISYAGYIKSASVYNAFVKHIKPFVNFPTLKRIVSKHYKREVIPWNSILQSA